MRIAPLEAPFDTRTATLLESMMPAGVPPIALFRTFAKNPAMAEAMHGWGSYALSKRSSIDMRTRELVIDRTCALCGCEYEWGVHVAFFAERVALDRDQIRSITKGSPDDACWKDPRDIAVLEMVDQLHETSTVSDRLSEELLRHFEEAQLLDLYLLAGWYHAISFAARAAGVPLEAGAPRFDDYALARSIHEF